MNEPVLHSNHSVFHWNRPVDVRILVGGPYECAVHDGDALAHARNRAVRAGKPSETRVNALYTIGIVPYSPDPGMHVRADVVYTRENDWYSRDQEPYGPDYDLRMLDDVASHVRHASGEPECRLVDDAFCHLLSALRLVGVFQQPVGSAEQAGDDD
jgi:hypothetical protein